MGIVEDIDPFGERHDSSFGRSGGTHDSPDLRECEIMEQLPQAPTALGDPSGFTPSPGFAPLLPRSPVRFLRFLFDRR